MNNEETIISLISQPSHLHKFVFSNHFLYQLYNIFAFELFGHYYFSPVALNIIVTFFTSYFVFRISLLIGFSKKLSLFIAMFYLLHWDILHWSTFLNLKDVLIQLMSIVLIFNILEFENNKRIKNVVFIGSVLLLFSTIRFYLPFLIFVSFIVYKILWVIFTANRLNRMYYIISSFILILLFLPLVLNNLNDEIEMLMISFTNPAIGMIRFLLTPIPFHFETNYSFLYFPSLLHWLTFPLFIYGAYISHKVNRKIMLFIFIYLFVILLFYGSYGQLQGPRHRLQIEPYIAMFQIIGLIALFYRDKFYRQYINKVEKYFEK
ncbi:hypothetical protein N9A28_08855 [Sulfurimonas sp.]|nr:hypothetical protein [Sulfurimonas sp.]